MVWVFTNHWGIAGAAFAWSVRVAFDSFLLLFYAFKRLNIPFNNIFHDDLRMAFFSLCALFTVSICAKYLFLAFRLNSWIFLSIIFLFLAIFSIFLWLKVMDDLEKSLLLNAVGALRICRNIAQR
jgi:hypothetical protein